MAPKRRRRATPPERGLDPGARLNRQKLPGKKDSPWGWVGSEAFDVSDITQEHLLAACGFADGIYSFCANKFSPSETNECAPGDKNDAAAKDESEEDVIVVSDDDEIPPCSKKHCKNNPNCLNYLGQDVWEDAEASQEAFLKAWMLGENPLLEARDPDLPVGLRNLGATCYANAFIQVWFQDLAFRSGVYQCQPSQDTEQKFEESPIFQLQVTFAALQEGTQNVYNPSKLVESLGLRTSEQQDAQEFSKLFMSHLDSEFKKQPAPALKSLLANQFQGKQIYGTICDTCRYRSERVTDFLEIEINFDDDSKLEDRIAALLQQERLYGDNKYLCGRCNSLQNATRYTELRQLPPVLHFSLLRFVYDVTSMERKKSKYAISFPTFIDMTQFLGSPAERKASVNKPRDERNVYELRGILLHKGPSAYHGHYLAQICDVTRQSWFQFNDETVTKTKVQTLGDGLKKKKEVEVIEIEDDDEKPPVPRKALSSAKKRRRILSDDEAIDETPTVPKANSIAGPSRISSKDAYMLIYARKESSRVYSDSGSNGQTHSAVEVPAPPPRAMEVITELNATHEEACETFMKNEREIKLCFDDARGKVMDIYRCWNVSSNDEENVVVSQEALASWISISNIANAVNPIKCKPPNSEVSANTSSLAGANSSTCLVPLRVAISSKISCDHDHIDPQQAGSLKRITQAAYRKIVSWTNCEFTPCLKSADICRCCVKEIFLEKLYQIQHPRLVQEFDEFSEIEVETGFWISKPWLKDWRLARPKMHIPSHDDPSPDSERFEHHVRCEHGNLSLTLTSRRRISEGSAGVLKRLFPSWRPLPADAEPCVICDCQINLSKNERLELRKKVEIEKARLRHMHDYALTGCLTLLEHVPCAVVPAQFVRSWRQWLARPAEVARPEAVDNSTFLCEHDMLVFDPNISLDLDSSIAIIKKSDWEVLEELYHAGPLIALENSLVEDENRTLSNKFFHDIQVCEQCRHKRKSDFEVAEITIRVILGRPVSTAPPKIRPIASMSSGLRHSRRLRQMKEFGERKKMPITKFTTVKDIKVFLQAETGVPTICQRLFYHGAELEDSSATIRSLGILANDLLELRQENEDEERLHSDVDEDRVIKPRRKEEGRAFGGTLLGTDSPERVTNGNSSAAEASEPSSPGADERQCHMCTFSNPNAAQVCSMCETSLQ